MQLLCEELIRVLAKQLELYGQVAQRLDEEREALVSKKPDAVFDIIRRKETLLLQIKTLDESRHLICIRLARHWGIRSTSLTLGEIEERVGGNAGERLGVLRARLRACLERLREAGEKNTRICRNGIDMLHRVLRTATRSATAGDKGYARDGSFQAGAPRSGALKKVTM